MRAKPLAHVAAPDDAQTATIRPPFDPEAFARESESKIPLEPDPSSGRPTAPPPPGIPQYQPGVTSGTMHSLGSVGSDTIPSLAVARDDLEWFELPKLARALLGHVDGTATIGAIAPAAEVPLDAAMATFHQLERDGLVTLRR